MLSPDMTSVHSSQPKDSVDRMWKILCKPLMSSSRGGII